MSARAPTDDDDIIGRISALIDAARFQEAIALARHRLSQGLDPAIHREAALLRNIAARLIDAGSEGSDHDATSQGLSILETERHYLAAHIPEWNYEYNLGRARQSLYNIERAANPNFHFSPESIDSLVAAKNHYWKAYKLHSVGDLRVSIPKLLVNLGTALCETGRVYEALDYYDRALHSDPLFPEANSCRAQDLMWLSSNPALCANTLRHEALLGFAVASRSPERPRHFRDDCREKHDFLRAELLRSGWLALDEAAIAPCLLRPLCWQSDYHLYCVKHHLLLSEHPIYCSCQSSLTDSLVVTWEQDGGSDQRHDYQDRLLLRMSSEYGFARLMYYQTMESFRAGTVVSNSHMISAIGAPLRRLDEKEELLRASFRMCFGVLDKIAFGLSRLFDLAPADEKLYFESFWRARRSGSSQERAGRWEAINRFSTTPLVALYSIATDLNAQQGEWALYKTWRNALEHRLLTLVKSAESNPRPITHPIPEEAVALAEFQERGLHLLQLVRSAVVFYALCSRIERASEHASSDD